MGADPALELSITTRSTISILACLIGIGSNPATASGVTYDDAADFFAALPGGVVIVTEAFDTVHTNAPTLTFSGVTSTTDSPPWGLSNTLKSRFNTLVDPDEPSPGRHSTVMWALPSGGFAFGFDVGGTNPAAANGVQLTVGDGSGPQTFVLHEVLGDAGSAPADGFFAS